jgi:hypothetical protein
MSIRDQHPLVRVKPDASGRISLKRAVTLLQRTQSITVLGFTAQINSNGLIILTPITTAQQFPKTKFRRQRRPFSFYEKQAKALSLPKPAKANEILPADAARGAELI